MHKKNMKNIINKLDAECNELKDLIYNSLIGNGLVIDDWLDQQQKDEIKSDLKLETIAVTEPSNTRVHYKCNFLDLLMAKIPPLMDREEYCQICIEILKTNPKIFEKYDLYEIAEGKENIIFNSKTYINDEKAKKILFEPNPDENQVVNEHNEVKYIETGDEQKTAIEAGNSRPYTDFFEEFVPNKVEESKRRHKYTVSLHRAIWYDENLTVFK